MSMRIGASVCHDFAVRSVPRAARTGRAPCMVSSREFSTALTYGATAVRTPPLRTNTVAASISGDSMRSGPGPEVVCRSPAMTAPVAGAGSSGARSSMPRAAVSSSMASTRVSPSTDARSLRAPDQPIETWSSCIAELGIESTLAGAARRLSSETIAAWVYCAIM